MPADFDKKEFVELFKRTAIRNAECGIRNYRATHSHLILFVWF